MGPKLRRIELGIRKRLPVYDDLSRLNRLQPIDTTDECALAATTGPAYHYDFASVYFKVYAFEDVERAEPLVYSVKFDHGKNLNLHHRDCKIPVRILYEQGLFATHSHVSCIEIFRLDGRGFVWPANFLSRFISRHRSERILGHEHLSRTARRGGVGKIGSRKTAHRLGAGSSRACRRDGSDQRCHGYCHIPFR